MRHTISVLCDDTPGVIAHARLVVIEVPRVVLVAVVVDDPMDLAMVKSINDIGHVMGKQTIAEFVENDAVLDKLREIGVDYAQGYAIGRPKPIADVLASPRTSARNSG